MRLLIHPAPAPRECLPDYFGRLAHLNGLRTTGWLFKGVQLALGGEREASHPDLIWPGLSRSELNAISVRSRPSRDREAWRKLRVAAPAYLCARLSPVCPICLRDAPIRPVQWRLDCLEACTVHRVRLVRSCPRCGQELVSWQGTSVRCRCGFDLRDAPTEQISEDAALVQQLLERSILGSLADCTTMARDPSAARLGNEPALAMFLRVASRALAPLASDKGSPAFGSPMSWLQISEMMGAYLTPWPTRFIDAVIVRWVEINQLRVERKPFLTPKHYLDMLRLFGRRQPSTSVWGPAFRQIEAQISEARKCTDTVPSSRRDERWESDQYITAKRAIKQVRISGLMLRTLIQRGVIPMTLGEKVGRHRAHLIDKSILAQLNEFLLKLMTCAEAEAFLDLNRNRMRRLVEAGILQGVWHYQSHRWDMYRISQLHGLVNGLADRASPSEQAPAGKLIRLPRIPNYGPHNARVFVDVVRAAISGAMPVYTLNAPAQGLSRFAVRQADIEAAGYVIHMQRPG